MKKLNFYFFEMLIQNTHLKFKAYIAQTIEKFLYKKGTSSLSRRFKAQQPVILPTVSHDSQHELEEHFWMYLAGKKLQFEIKFMPIQTNRKKHDFENIYMHRHIVWSDWSASKKTKQKKTPLLYIYI